MTRDQMTGLDPLPNGTIVERADPYTKKSYFEMHTDLGVKVCDPPAGWKPKPGWSYDATHRTNDFVGRLEFAAKHWDKEQGLYERSLEWQAAREIERLTAENDRLRAEVSRLKGIVAAEMLETGSCSSSDQQSECRSEP